MPNEAEVRARIVETARGFLGAHYLAGTFGAIPNVTDTYAPDRSIQYVSGDWNWSTIGVCTAEIVYSLRRLRCCGRYASSQVNGSREPWSRSSPPPGGAFGAWMARARGAAEYQPRPLFDAPAQIRHRTGGYQGHLFPRRHCFVNHGENENPDFVYLGEDCGGKHHFDCVGFVCRVLGQALGRTIRFGLPGSAGCGNWLDQGNTDWHDDVASCVRASPGDIFLSSSHMALVYDRGSNVRLIHANGDRNGVEITNFTHPSRPSAAGTWSQNFHVIHLSCNFLGVRETATAAATVP